MIRFSVISIAVLAIAAIIFLVVRPRASDDVFAYESQAKELAALGEEEKFSAFRRYSPQVRLEIYHYFYRHSGHPRDVGLAFGGFDDRPKETVDLILDKLSESEDFGLFLEYRHILYVISQSTYNICEDEDRKNRMHSIVRKYDINPDTETELRKTDLGGCSFIK